MSTIFHRPRLRSRPRPVYASGRLAKDMAKEGCDSLCKDVHALTLVDNDVLRFIPRRCGIACCDSRVQRLQECRKCAFLSDAGYDGM